MNARAPFSIGLIVLVATTAACALSWEESAVNDRYRCNSNADCADGFVCLAGLCNSCSSGTRDPGEECDDGNLVDGDGCDHNCTTTRCGNGILTTGETCDDGNGTLTDACLDTPAQACVAATCGDGFVYDGVETCDWTDTADLRGYCGDIAGATETAVDGGSCGLICRFGYRECDGVRPPPSQTSWQTADGEAACETDLYTSDDHCGGCGTPCDADETCVVATCLGSALELPVDVSFAANMPITADATHLYWAELGEPFDTIYRAAFGGTEVEQVFQTSDDISVSNAVNLAVDATHVYFTARSSGGGQLVSSLYRMNKDGLGQPVRLLGSNDQSDAFVLDGDTVYANIITFESGPPIVLDRLVSFDKATPTDLTDHFTTNGYLLGLAADATHLLFGLKDGVQRIAKSGGGPTPLTSSANSNPVPVALDSGWAYFRINAGTGALLRVSVTAPATPVSVFPLDTPPLTSIVPSGAYTYARALTSTGTEILRWPSGEVPALTRFIDPVGDPRDSTPNDGPVQLGSFTVHAGKVYALYRVANERSAVLALTE